jgi:hypothetical protein
MVSHPLMVFDGDGVICRAPNSSIRRPRFAACPSLCRRVPHGCRLSACGNARTTADGTATTINGASGGKQVMPDENRDLCAICCSPLQTLMNEVHADGERIRRYADEPLGLPRDRGGAASPSLHPAAFHQPKDRQGIGRR